MQEQAYRQADKDKGKKDANSKKKFDPSMGQEYADSQAAKKTRYFQN
jgi:hypothetical protein